MNIPESFNQMVSSFVSEEADGLDIVVQFNIQKGDNPFEYSEIDEIEENNHYFIEIKNKKCAFHPGIHPTPDLSIAIPIQGWILFLEGEIRGMELVMKGWLKAEGKLSLMKEVEKLFQRDSAKRTLFAPYVSVMTSTADGVRQLQEEKARKIVRFAYDNCPFYRKIYKGVNIDRFEFTDLPVVDKDMLMKHFHDVVTDSRLRNIEELHAFVNDEKKPAGTKFKNEFIIVCTSGRSGVPGIFPYNTDAWALSLIPELRARKVLHKFYNGKVEDKPPKLAFITSPRKTTASRMRAAHIPSFAQTVKIYSVNEPVVDIVHQLNEFQPDAFDGYTYGIHEMACEQIRGNLNIQPKRVGVSGEACPESVRRTIRDAWNIEPYNSYRASEALTMAFECDKHAGMHINSDLVLLESVDKNNNPLQNGERGHCLITNLYNYTFPLIRYNIGDKIILSDNKCTCGLPFPILDNEIHCFRTFDKIKLIDMLGNRLSIEYQDVAPVLDAVPPILRWQLRQTGANRIQLKVITRRRDDIEKCVPSIRNKFKMFFDLSDSFTCDVQYAEELKAEMGTAKFKPIINTYN
ncbi:MAG: SCP2 sterol-binding domain-containing protein [Desulfobacteraceae bacterium]|jgi:phenylacetate-coenzyme A ligase PaaK-like adenylate-forming protein/putative sterol carrier protein